MNRWLCKTMFIAFMVCGLVSGSVWANLDGLYKPLDQSTNMYVQTYREGSLLIIISPDAKTEWYVFLHEDFRQNPIEVFDYAGKGHKLTLEFDVASRALATLELAQGGEQSWTLIKNFNAPDPESTIDGIYKDRDGAVNLYLQTYDTGSALLIFSPDLEQWIIFLDENWADGIELDHDYVDMGYQLSMVRLDETSYDCAITTPADVRMPYLLDIQFPASLVETEEPRQAGAFGPELSFITCQGLCGGPGYGGCMCDAQCKIYEDCCWDYDQWCSGVPGPGPGFQTCQGKCGSQGMGGCWCDSTCFQYGDCCPDYNQWCGGISPFKSCQGKCGGQGIGGCWCDSTCFQYGDCCPDYNQWCGGMTFNTCQGKCGGKGTGNCWCDAGCAQYGDCCPDYVQWCGQVPGPGFNTCQGKCGGQGIGGCWCDSQCMFYGDCCPDYNQWCGGVTFNSCQGKCGGQGSGNCWCDSQCVFYGDCCPDYNQWCGVAFNSCQGKCGGQGSGNCWCDPLCAQYGDCCPDYAQWCGGWTPTYGSCQGICGSQSPTGCWCDSGCQFYGDCCTDFTYWCGIWF